MNVYRESFEPLIHEENLSRRNKEIFTLNTRSSKTDKCKIYKKIRNKNERWSLLQCHTDMLSKRILKTCKLEQQK